MKKVGIAYLQRTLQSIIDEVYVYVRMCVCVCVTCMCVHEICVYMCMYVRTCMNSFSRLL